MTHSTEQTLRVASITAGGAGMFCGSCMRDNTVTAALKRMGVDITLIPTFTPIRTDERDVSQHSVFLGGINIYLDQRWPWLNRLPFASRRFLDHPLLLGALSRLALQTRRDDDGAVALSLLRGEHGNQASELRDLATFLTDDLRPDVVNLTNLLIAGFLPTLRQRFDGPVTVTLQGDDIFLDSLSSPMREDVLSEMQRLAQLADGFLTFSEDYRQRMSGLFEIPTARIKVVPLGLANPAEFRGAPVQRTQPPTLGYLARICPEKGFDRLIDAYLALRGLPGTENLRLSFGGWLGASDRAFFKSQMQRLRRELDSGAVTHVALPDRQSKVELLQSLDVFSVPTRYLEPKGLYLLEALASGVPAVQPNHGSFPEIIGRTGGALLVDPEDPEELASTLYRLLRDPMERRQLSEQGPRGVADHHTDDLMALRTLEVWSALTN